MFWSFWENCRSGFELDCRGWVLMDNHFHLLVEPPEGNLSQTGQWLNVSHSVWFNRRHQRSGHLFQGDWRSLPTG
jgi:putative transposase